MSLNPQYIVECFRRTTEANHEIRTFCLNPLYIVECFRPFDRLRDLVYTLLFVTLYDDFPSLTAPQGERSDHARMGIAEPSSSYTEGVESTVYRGMLSEG